jgi:nicotinamide mononucleotide transporter
MNNWTSNNYIEIFGAITGIIYVFLEIRQTIWLWPLGLITSAAYVWIFFSGKLYADMSLQAYYVVISVLGWYWWVRGGSELRAKGKGKRVKGGRRRAEGEERRAEGGEQSVESAGTKDQNKNSPLEGGQGDVKTDDIINKGLKVTRLNPKTGIVLSSVFIVLYFIMWLILSRLTDSPVPGWDAFLTSLSIVATWMLARKIYEHWYLWIVINMVSMLLYLTRGLYPTVVLYFVYFIMSFFGLFAWRSSLITRIQISTKEI